MVKKVKAINYKDQPFWFKAINVAWKGSFVFGAKPSLDKDSLIKAARQSTGLIDLGKDFYDEPLDRLLYSVKHEAKLHPAGMFITRQRIIQLLSVRLRAEQWFKKHPEILAQELYPVFLICGLQRTGTTKLQRLLAADPDNRALLSWEALNPAPLNGDFKTGHERKKVAKTSERALKLMSPGFFAIHPVEYNAPEEDVLLLDVSFLSTTAEATMHVPAYAEWLEKTDQSAAYEYMVKLMKLLQWQRPAKRWVLKTPHHLEFPDLADRYFGNVRFIWTHREVDRSIPSFLSMVSYARILFSRNVSPETVAQHWIRKTSYMLQKAMDFYKKEDNQNKFVHIPYNQIKDQPIKAISRIYAAQELIITPRLKEIFLLANSENPQGKYGSHEYSLNDFGLDMASLNHITAHYQSFLKELNFDAVK